MAQNIREYTGLWRCTHWYPSNTHVGEDSDEHRMKIYWDGDTMVLESLPENTNGYMLVRLALDDDIATGSWHETSKPDGAYKGAEYSGYGALTVDPETFYMEGKWAGAGLDRKLNKMRIYTGSWEIAPLRDV